MLGWASLLVLVTGSNGSGRLAVRDGEGSCNGGSCREVHFEGPRSRDEGSTRRVVRRGSEPISEGGRMAIDQSPIAIWQPALMIRGRVKLNKSFRCGGGRGDF